MIDEDALLAALLAEEGFATAPEDAPQHAELNEKPLSALQQGLVFWQQLHANSPAYTVSRVWQLHLSASAITTTHLVGLLESMAIQQPSLRARIAYCEHTPVFVFNTSLVIELHDFSTLALADAQAKAQQLAQRHSNTALPIGEYLCRITLITLPDNHWQLGADFHHLITDAWSGEVWQQQLSRAFDGLSVTQHTTVTTPNPVATTSNTLFPGDVLTQQNATHPLWQNALPAICATQIKGIDLLQGDKPRPASWTAKGAQYRQAISSALVEQLQRFSQERNSSLFHPLLSLWMHACANLRSKKDSPILCAYAQADRPAGSDTSFNCWIDTKVALLTAPHLSSLTESMAELKQVNSTTSPSLSALVSTANPIRHANQQALSHIHFNIEINDTAHTEPTEASAAHATYPEVKKVQLIDHSVRFDLSMDVYLHGNTGEWIIGYRTELFSDAFIIQLLRCVEAFMSAAIATPNQPLAKIWTTITQYEATCLPALIASCTPTLSSADTSENPHITKNPQQLINMLVGLRDCIADVVTREVNKASDSSITHHHDATTERQQQCLQHLHAGSELTEHSWFSLGIDSLTLLKVAHAFNEWLSKGTTSCQPRSNEFTPIPLNHFYHSPSIGHFIEHYAYKLHG